MSYIYLNNKLNKASAATLETTNKAFRYGDGFFETIRIVNATCPLWAYHQTRILSTLQILNGEFAKTVNTQVLHNLILNLAIKNKLTNARVRLSFYRGHGGLADFTNNLFNFTIEAFALQEGNFQLNQNGLYLGCYTTHKKISGVLSNVKSASAQIYSLAAQYCKAQKLNDVFILNENNHIVDTTIANIFIVKNNIIYTPNAKSGAVLGCMRSYIMANFTSNKIIETNLTVTNLETADEVFLTNAILGIRWVTNYNHINYTPNIAFNIYNTLITPLFNTN